MKTTMVSSLWLCVVLLAIVVVVNADTIHYKYTYESTATHSWNSAATWEENKVPTADDDVDILLFLCVLAIGCLCSWFVALFLWVFIVVFFVGLLVCVSNSGDIFYLISSREALVRGYEWTVRQSATTNTNPFKYERYDIYFDTLCGCLCCWLLSSNGLTTCCTYNRRRLFTVWSINTWLGLVSHHCSWVLLRRFRYPFNDDMEIPTVASHNTQGAAEMLYI